MKLAGLVTAGGLATRMGGPQVADKALLRPWGADGPTLLERAHGELTRLAAPVWVACRAGRSYTGYACVTDAVADCGPMGGIEAGLAAAEAAGCDALLATATTWMTASGRSPRASMRSSSRISCRSLSASSNQRRAQRQREKELLNTGAGADIKLPYNVPGGEKALGVASAEQQLVAALIRDPALIPLAESRVKPEQFLMEDMAAAYAAVLEATRRGRLPDLATLAASLPEETISRLSLLLARNYDVNLGAGEIGFENLRPGEGNATYRNRIIDAIYNMDGETLNKGAKYEVR